MVMSRSKSYNVTNNSLNKERQLKRQEKAAKRAHRQEQKATSYLTEDENLSSWKIQLNKLGLEIRDIPADGNCLFRALADQLDGCTELHALYRAEVCDYIIAHKTDFEPFIDEKITFDKYVSELRKQGTFAGNDALVAFANLHNVTIVIHQLNHPALRIVGSNGTCRELHLSYHNGEHYSSIRRIGDKSRLPVHIKIQSKNDEKKGEHTDLDPVDRVAIATGVQDKVMIAQYLSDFEDDVDTVIDHIKSYGIMAADNNNDTSSKNPLTSSTTTVDSGVWSESSNTSSCQPKNFDGKKKVTKAERKKEKKKRAEERRRNIGNPGNEEQPTGQETYEIVCQMSLLSV